MVIWSWHGHDLGSQHHWSAESSQKPHLMSSVNSRTYMAKHPHMERRFFVSYLRCPRCGNPAHHGTIVIRAAPLPPQNDLRLQLQTSQPKIDRLLMQYKIHLLSKIIIPCYTRCTTSNLAACSFLDCHLGLATLWHAGFQVCILSVAWSKSSKC